MAFDARSVCADQLANGETPRGQPLKLLEPGTWPPSLGAPQKQRPTLGRFTIDLIVVSLVTYVFDLSASWVSLFVVLPLGLRKRIIGLHDGSAGRRTAQIAA